MNSPVRSLDVVEGAYANDYGLLKPSRMPKTLSVSGTSFFST